MLSFGMSMNWIVRLKLYLDKQVAFLMESPDE